ncbi:Uncharacterised protein, partial [Mycoplasma putrefaciens]
MTNSNLEEKFKTYLIVLYIYMVLITIFFIMSIYFMLFRRKKFLKKYFQKYIDIESLDHIRIKNILEIIVYLILYLIALALPIW